MTNRNREAGQSIVLVALALTVLLGMMGLAIDFGYYRFARRNMQLASDAAATAGAGELVVGDWASAAGAAATKNGISLPVVTNACPQDPNTIAVNNPPCFLGASDPHSGDSKYVEVVVKQDQPLFFSRILGASTVPVVTRAEAEQGSGANCIYALDPFGAGAVTAVGAILNSQCGIVDESAAKNDALECAFALINAPSTAVVGGVQNLLCGINPAAKTGIHTPTPADPLVGLPAPSVGPCGAGGGQSYFGYPGTSGGLQITPAMGTVNLNPGVYCGGIKIWNGATAVFSPGVYILTSPTTGPAFGLTIDLGTNVTGTRVTFYNTQIPGKASGSITLIPASLFAGVNLVAPTSGTYEGILFFQDRSLPNPATIVGAVTLNTVLQGTYYFPDASVTFALDDLAEYNILVAKHITFGLSLVFNTGHFGNNYSSLANGSPVRGGAGVLVE